eukprot:1236276-Lingulodinium_polyedra.AAC.1
MKPGMDFCWVFGGRAARNEAVIRETFSKKGWKYKVYTTVLDYRGLQTHDWRRQRGVANSRTMSCISFVSVSPKDLPQEHWYVDSGCPLYMDVVNRAFVDAPQDLVFVSRAVRETSLKRMVAQKSAAA